MSVAYDITARVRPPRAAFINFPMGNTAGRPSRPDEQRRIVRAALSALARMKEPGSIVDLGLCCDEPAPDGRPWQDWVYTREYRRAFMKKRDGSTYTEKEEAQ